ncbi:hypothetical protein M6D81_30025 [Paenibacillus sp. J5C_2022]|uniref:hypothetical protein n=1 Tax=Paenibacillus sp. J5C2022 TaxID=2977129 RepID=UPI0021D076A9|nr:hypothetical protein [Paenibacillus sp. J5C2022]MCU6712947.1 hypothetical protein [Paenibacillus sp. J5C2022]
MKKWFISIGVVSVLAAGTYIYASGVNGNAGQDIQYEAKAVGDSESETMKGDAQVSSIKEIVFEANIVYTVDQDKIGDFADLVVLGVPQESLEERKSDIRYFPKDPLDKSNTPRDIEYFQSFV